LSTTSEIQKDSPLKFFGLTIKPSKKLRKEKDKNKTE
jgi:hypothetical protein